MNGDWGSSPGIGRRQRWAQQAEEEGQEERRVLRGTAEENEDRGRGLGFSEEVIMGQEQELQSQIAGS